MKLKKTKKDIIEAIKTKKKALKTEMFEIDAKVQAVAPPSFVNALAMSAKNKQMVIDRMKEKEKEKKELMAQTVDRKANATPKTDAMKKMKLVEQFVNESFKGKSTLKENVLSVLTPSRADLTKLIKNARENEVKYTISRLAEGYQFNYQFEVLTEDLAYSQIFEINNWAQEKIDELGIEACIDNQDIINEFEKEAKKAGYKGQDLEDAIMAVQIYIQSEYEKSLGEVKKPVQEEVADNSLLKLIKKHVALLDEVKLDEPSVDWLSDEFDDEAYAGGFWDASMNIAHEIIGIENLDMNENFDELTETIYNIIKYGDPFAVKSTPKKGQSKKSDLIKEEKPGKKPVSWFSIQGKKDKFANEAPYGDDEEREPMANEGPYGDDEDEELERLQHLKDLYDIEPGDLTPEELEELRDAGMLEESKHKKHHKEEKKSISEEVVTTDSQIQKLEKEIADWEKSYGTEKEIYDKIIKSNQEYSKTGDKEVRRQGDILRQQWEHITLKKNLLNGLKKDQEKKQEGTELPEPQEEMMKEEASSSLGKRTGVITVAEYKDFLNDALEVVADADDKEKIRLASNTYNMDLPFIGTYGGYIAINSPISEDQSEDEVEEGKKEMKMEKPLKESALSNSKFKNIIGEYFNYSGDFDFLDIVAQALERLDFDAEEIDDDAVMNSVDDTLTYISDQWVIAQHYASSPADLDWEEVIQEFRDDMLSIINKIKQ